MSDRNPFFGGGRYFSGNDAMKFAGLSCTLHLPKARESEFRDGKEVSQRLPERNPRAAFLVDNYPNAPSSWMRSEAGVLSYMVPVKAGHGMWLDFNANMNHTHDVAIVISTQGINALTTMETREPKLVQYRSGDTCPMHRIPFVGNARCNECKYEWSPQNYLATTGTPRGYFWLDGFRTTEGVTRQWLFTEETSRGVAAAVLGENRVHAIGVAFFLSKEPKPAPVVPTYRPRTYKGGSDVELLGGSSSRSMTFGTTSLRRGGGEVLERSTLEIAAGAKIDQLVYADPKPLDYWQTEPAGMIVINYTDEETALDVLASGGTPESEGPLGDLGVEVGLTKHAH